MVMERGPDRMERFGMVNDSYEQIAGPAAGRDVSDSGISGKRKVRNGILIRY